jgi:hypothetical protein
MEEMLSNLQNEWRDFQPLVANDPDGSIPDVLPGAHDHLPDLKTLEIEARSDYKSARVLEVTNLAALNTARPERHADVAAARFALVELFEADTLTRDEGRIQFWLQAAADLRHPVASYRFGLSLCVSCTDPKQIATGLKYLCGALGGLTSRNPNHNESAWESARSLVNWAVNQDANALQLAIVSRLSDTMPRALVAAKCERLAIEVRESFASFSSYAAPVEHVVVLLEDIDTEGSDFKELKRYQALRQGLPLVPFGNVEAGKRQLLTEFPWLSDTIETICSRIQGRLLIGAKSFWLPPMILRSPPGYGKTRFVSRMAALLSGGAAPVPFVPLAVAGSSDSTSLKGVSRGWASGRPCLIIDAIYRHRVPNILLFVDELDKAASDLRHNGGSLHDALLEIVERESAKRYCDTYLLCQLDISRTSVVAAANDLTFVPRALLSRMEVIEFDAPRREHMPAVVRATLDDIRRSDGVIGQLVPDLGQDEIDAIVSACDANPRAVAMATRAWVFRRAEYEHRLAPRH